MSADDLWIRAVITLSDETTGESGRCSTVNGFTGETDDLVLLCDLVPGHAGDHYDLGDHVHWKPAEEPPHA